MGVDFKTVPNQMSGKFPLILFGTVSKGGPITHFRENATGTSRRSIDEILQRPN